MKNNETNKQLHSINVAKGALSSKPSPLLFLVCDPLRHKLTA